MPHPLTGLLRPCALLAGGGGLLQLPMLPIFPVSREPPWLELSLGRLSSASGSGSIKNRKLDLLHRAIVPSRSLLALPSDW